MERSRLRYAGLIVVVIVAGLASRRYSENLPSVLGAYAGDTLWALMVFLGLGVIWRTGPTERVAGIALAVAWIDEFSQLHHAVWIDAVRRTTLGAMVLGRGFVWSDLARASC